MVFTIIILYSHIRIRTNVMKIEILAMVKVMDMTLDHAKTEFMNNLTFFTLPYEYLKEYYELVIYNSGVGRIVIPYLGYIETATINFQIASYNLFSNIPTGGDFDYFTYLIEIPIDTNRIMIYN